MGNIHLILEPEGLFHASMGILAIFLFISSNHIRLLAWIDSWGSDTLLRP